MDHPTHVDEDDFILVGDECDETIAVGSSDEEDGDAETDMAALGNAHKQPMTPPSSITFIPETASPISVSPSASLNSSGAASSAPSGSSIYSGVLGYLSSLQITTSTMSPGASSPPISARFGPSGYGISAQFSPPIDHRILEKEWQWNEKRSMTHNAETRHRRSSSSSSLSSKSSQGSLNKKSGRIPAALEPTLSQPDIDYWSTNLETNAASREVLHQYLREKGQNDLFMFEL